MNVLVTGASSGIGAALARRLASQGETVGVVARRGDRLAAVLEQCQQWSPSSRMWVADVGDVELAARVALEAWDAFGHLDVLVNNAAIPKRREITVLTPEEVEHVMRVNFLGPARMTLAVLPRMLARDAGTIVNVSSVGGRLGIIHEAAYSASKFALCGWSESMAVDLHGTGVSVKLIEPGPIDTEIWDLPDNEDPLYQGPKVPPELVADGIIEALKSEKFEHYLPDLKPVVDGKNADIDAFIAATAQMAKARQP
ncbi:MAG TPA: SDR family oxidoreductase [Acidimicrobiales bacterium]|nr:SDR family oxidoreductase [Acidimicrobiales bacterium]